MDPLADVLEVTRVRGAIMAQVVAQAPWGLAIEQSSGAAFHAVTAGTCWLGVGGEPAFQLMPGDVVLLPTGIAHTLASGPDERTRAFDRVAKEQLLTPAGDLELRGAGACTRFLCAAYDYDHAVAHPLLSLLPSALHLPAGEPGDTGGLTGTLRLLKMELGGRPPGSRVAVERLIDVLFVHTVRAWLGEQSEDRGSWLLALRDPVVAVALALLHHQPAAPWTIDLLARQVNVSRATLARRFTQLVGDPPLAYLAKWRMDIAAQRLRETRDPVGTIARGVGYSSEYAFSRAFSRIRGMPPGRYRTSV